MKSKCLFFLLCFFSIYASHGQNLLTLVDDSTYYPIHYRVKVLEDASRKLTINDILKADNQSRFQYAPKGNMNHQFTNANYWFKLQVTIDKVAIRRDDWLIQMKNPNIDTLMVFSFDNQNKLINSYLTGDIFSFNKRPVNYHKFLFPLHFQNTDTLTLYIKTAGYYAKEHNFGLITQTQVLDDAQYSLGLAIFLIAILFALLAYNTLLYVSIRDITYFHYVAYLFFIILYLVAVSGIGFQYLYPNVPIIASVLANVANVLSIIFAMLFSYYFLKVKEVLPAWVAKAIVGFIIFNVLLLIFLFITIWFKALLVIWFRFLTISLVLWVTSILSLGFWSLKRGVRPAKFFLIAWSMLLLAVVVGVLKVLGILTDVSIDTTIQVGTVLEALFLSFGLADRIKVIEKEKQQAQAKSIEVLRENEKIIQEQNQLLERKVQERTIALAEMNDNLALTNTDLNQTNEELQTTLELVNHQKELIEDKNKDITDSIRYARRIQESILPSTDQMKTALNCFVFYRPKDIVSGDFYWFTAKDNLYMIAAVDCTGHGVPGAFMSVLGNSLLGQIVNENDIVNPSEILLQLNKSVRHVLHQDKNSQSQDGMDMGICVIDKETNTICYAGAKRPLYIIRQGELSELKVNKNSIGGRTEVEAFESVVLQMEKDDLIYLSTDGYADQFGGSEKRKYMSKNFKKFLLSIHHLPIKEQEQALNAEFDQWKDNEKQTDDILVIGVKF